MQITVADLEDAQEDADNVAELAPKEVEIVQRFTDTVAKCLAEGMNKPVGFFASAVADAAEHHTKTNLKQSIKDRSEDYRGGDKQELDRFITDRLEKVIVVKTTDHRQGAEYVWDFGTFKVETRSGKDGRGHYAFDQFRDMIFESGGVNLATPTSDRRGGEEWRDFMLDIIDERGEERYTRGPRTEAYEALSNKVKRLTGYGTPEGALDHTGIWIIRDNVDIPEWWHPISNHSPDEDRNLCADSVNEVRVHESVIKPILEDAEITRSAFYHELDARNQTIPGTSGASMTEWVNGSDERFWTLLPDIGTPGTYVPNPNSNVTVYGAPLFEQSDEQEQADEPDTSGASDADDDSDGFDSVGDTA